MRSRSATATAPRTIRQATSTAPVSARTIHIRVQHRHQRSAVTVACGSEERVDHLPLAGQVGVGHRGLPMDARE
jgi:hypothetical protein